MFSLMVLANLVLPIILAQGLEGEDERTIFQYDANHLEVLDYLKYEPAILRKFKTAVMRGYSLGFEKGDSVNVLSYFECGIDKIKTLLQVYQGPKTQAILALYEKIDHKILEPPEEFLDLIMENDVWMLHYRRTSDNGYDVASSSPTSDQSPQKVKESNKLTISTLPFGTDPFTLKTKSTLKVISTTKEKDFFATIAIVSEKDKEELKYKILEYAVNWYLIVEYEGTDGPEFLEELQNSLDELAARNPGKYTKKREVYWRFALHMARSFKMMCGAHHRLLEHMRQLSREKDNKKSLTQLLFSCAKTYNVTHEQVLFLQILHKAVKSDTSEPIKYYYTENEQHKGTIIIYDDTPRCPIDRITTPKTYNIEMLNWI